MSHTIEYGVGSHEPIFHRRRTGNSTAEEWERWERETSEENLDLLEKLGMSHAHIACTKGFGLEYEKPLIERAANFAERAAKRGITTSAYIQGFPVYYETFLLEVPEAEKWLARQQDGDYIPWGGQTFRRWMDPTREEFHEYEMKLVEYILKQFHPTHFGLDNTVPPVFYSDSARASFRSYLRERYDEKTAIREFGIPCFDAVDLPHFDPIYYPRDAYRVVGDPILQEWARWRSRVTSDFCAKLRELIHSIAPEVKLSSASGCDGLRYNQLFVRGVDFEDRIAALDETHMEESGWRPGVIEGASDLDVIMDERHPLATEVGGSSPLRVSTDSRLMKILQNYDMGGHRGFWGEFERESKLVAIAHNMTFGRHGNGMGSVGPLAANEKMIDDIRDVIEWGNKHIDVLVNREDRVAPIAVWRGTSTIGFVRHIAVWEACAVEQMLYEQHLPFTILLDGGLEKFLEGRQLLILPGTRCVSEKQVELITQFVDRGGNVLLLGESGTRNERACVRTKYAFAHLFGGEMPELERIGPPHWVPSLDFSRVPASLRAQYGKGKVALVHKIEAPHELDLTRDVYMPERQVMPKDVVPPKNESDIMLHLDELYGPERLRAVAPRWTLCEFWKRGSDLVVCCANLRKGHDGGPVVVNLGDYSAEKVSVHYMLENDTVERPVIEGQAVLDRLNYFAAVEVKGVLG